MDTLLHDLRYALRTLRKNPGFTLVAVLTLALGIGANTAIFSVVEPLLLNPFPFDGGERMVYLWRQESRSKMSLAPSAEQFELWRDRAASLDGVEPFNQLELRRSGSDGATIVPGMAVSPTFLSFLGLEPALGRGFLEEEATAGGEAVVMLGSAYWKREYGGRNDVLGSAIELDGRVHTVVGVMPERAELFHKADFWLPFRGDWGRLGVPAIGRLRPGVGEEAARLELERLAGELESDGLPGEWSPRLVRAGDEVVKTPFRHALLILSGAVGLVLLIACANVAHLFLARAVARGREFAVRAALGAGRRRIVRQLLTESLLLALAAGALGLLLASWGITAIVHLRPVELTALERAELNPSVFLFAVVVSLCTAAFFGLWPALRASRFDPAHALRGAAPGAGGTVASARGRKLIIALEVALTVVLLVGAGLLVRTLAHLQMLDPGFRPAGLLAVQVDLPPDRYADKDARESFRQQLLERIHALPGVEAATFAMDVPPRYAYRINQPEVEGGGAAADGASRPIALNAVHSDFFRVAGIRIREGRSFTEAEVRDRAPVMVVGAALARQLWPDGVAIGRRLRFSAQGRWSSVIGVVDDVAAHGLIGMVENGSFQVYEPFMETGARVGVLAVRAQGDGGTLTASLRALLREVEPEIVIREVTTASSLLDGSIATPRFNMVLLTIFATLALVLAAVGLFAVLSYIVGQRTREIGVRVALGAPVGQVVRLILVQGMAPVATGLALGLAGAVAAVRAMDSLVHGISTLDPATFVGVPFLLAAVALLASWLPARRAARVDPMVALRAE